MLARPLREPAPRSRISVIYRERLNLDELNFVNC